MKKHRVRQAKSIDGQGDHLFIEIIKDRWQEFDKLPSYKEIEQYNQTQSGNKFDITFSSRSFDIGIIKNWIDLEPIV